MLYIHVVRSNGMGSLMPVKGIKFLLDYEKRASLCREQRDILKRILRKYKTIALLFKHSSSDTYIELIAVLDHLSLIQAQLKWTNAYQRWKNSHFESFSLA